MRFFIGILIIIGSFKGVEQTENVEIFHLKFFFLPPHPTNTFPALSMPARKLFSVFPNQMKQSKLFLFLFLLHFKSNLPCAHTQIQMYFYINKNLFGIFQKLLEKNLDSIMDRRFYFGPHHTNIHIYFCF